MDVQINMWGVLAAAVSSMVVGATWYAKSTFGATWQKLIKLTDKQMAEKAAPALTIAFLSSLVMAYVLAHVSYLSSSFFATSYQQAALTTAWWMWVGFQGFRVIMHDAFEQRRRKLTLINIGNDLVTILVMGLVIGLIGL
jgi:hypothetical protein